MACFRHSSSKPAYSHYSKNPPEYESSWERNVQGTKRPENESSIYRRFVPVNETSWERNVLLPNQHPRPASGTFMTSPWTTQTALTTSQKRGTGAKYFIRNNTPNDYHTWQVQLSLNVHRIWYRPVWSIRVWLSGLRLYLQSDRDKTLHHLKTFLFSFY